MANKKQNHSSNKPVKHFLDLLYMTPTEVKAKDIADLFAENVKINVELWDDMNVIELLLSNESSVDLEPLDINFKDPSDTAFVRNRSIRTIFAVNCAEEDLEIVKQCFETIIDQFAGFLCADTPDFKPVYVGNSGKTSPQPE